MRLFLGSFATVVFYDDNRHDLRPCFDGKWVAPEHLHMTWFFLGERESPEKIVDALQPLKTIDRRPLAIQGFGMYGRPDPKIFYLKTSTKALLPIYRRIEELLGEKARNPFCAHVTLARIKRFRSFGFRHLKRPWMSEPLGSIEPTIRLVESRLTPSGPIYIPLEAF
jgi:2'-5' RNA ligase